MRLLILLTTLALSIPVLATAAQNITTFKLKNGMDAVVIQDRRAPVVTHMVWYRVGAADEDAGKSGIAHLLEHLMFKGTKKFGPGEFSRVVSANGGSENAFTSYDYTGYFQRVAADRLGLMMEMEADRMRGLILTEEDVLTERDVVLEERNSRTENNPGSLFSEQRLAALYLNHPYGVPIIGWKHEIEALNRKDAFAFYKKFYAPNNAILVVAGDVDPVEVEKLANKYYGKLKPTEGIEDRARPTEPPQLAERRLRFADERVSQPYVIRTYLAPERNASDQKTAAALTLLAELLGGDGLSSFLGQKLQLEQKLALHVSAFYDGLSLDKSGFGLVVVPVEGVSLQEAEDAMDNSVAEFIKVGVNEEHLARLKTQIRASGIYSRDSVQGLARKYGEALTSGLTVQDVDDWPAILEAVTPADIIAAAEMVFDRKKSVTGWLMRAETVVATGADK
jgi:zinc protease